ncbi:tetratricopeptide repeat protein [Rhodoplanes sp. Z2-YC6860]|uniref:tetratricopeptide repeat protein n=1 Tax=Rhodoplanes sp. Z2-YC6860 TaxID=674703 RepID=UPI00078D65E2|nr:tetratricopeptide repeat protein [Rhodoplanes sp. Z2-YC6860]AMN44860.1 Sel1 domain protein repeat-containing protein [Rhodoplanes sp. Z2-YC6860]
MSFLPRIRFGKDPETELLEQRVSTLQAALKQCSEVAGRWSEFRRTVTAVIAVLMLGLGFALGVYREPIQQSAVDLARMIGLANSVPSADAAYAAYKNGDYDSALRMARSLAAGGDAAAQFYLGVMYSEGKGVPQDYAEAAKWYRAAADRGDAQAQYNLGISYAKGEAGDQDDVSAYFWLNLAAARFLPSDTRRGVAISSREAVAKRMTADQIAVAQKRASMWKPQ